MLTVRRPPRPRPRVGDPRGSDLQLSLRRRREPGWPPGRSGVPPIQPFAPSRPGSGVVERPMPPVGIVVTLTAAHGANRLTARVCEQRAGRRGRNLSRWRRAYAVGHAECQASQFLSVFCRRRGSTPRGIRCFLGREGGLGRKWADQTGSLPWRPVKVAFSPDSGDARPAGSAEPGSAVAAEAARCRFRPVSTSTCGARSPRDCA